MDEFLAVDKIIRDAYAAGDKDTLLRVAGVLALHAAPDDLLRALNALEVPA